MKLWDSEYSLSFGKPKKKHLFWRTLGNLLLIFLTGGVWLIWLIVRKLSS